MNIVQKDEKIHSGSLPVVTPSLGSSGSKVQLKNVQLLLFMSLSKLLNFLTLSLSISKTGDNHAYDIMLSREVNEVTHGASSDSVWS